MAAGKPPPTDREIIALCRSGEPRGYDALLAAHYQYLLSLCWRIAGDRQEAEDIVQEVLVRLVRNVERLDPQPSLRPWLRRVATNLCINSASRRTREPLILADDGPVEASAITAVTDGDDPVGDQAAGRAELAAVGAAIRGLSRLQRAILAMRILDGLSYEAIASVVQMPVGTVKSHLSRARAQLRLAVAVPGEAQRI